MVRLGKVRLGQVTIGKVKFVLPGILVERDGIIERFVIFQLPNVSVRAFSLKPVKAFFEVIVEAFRDDLTSNSVI